jgi:hypothetical protein
LIGKEAFMWLRAVLLSLFIAAAALGIGVLASALLN